MARVLATRALPEAVETRLAQGHEARLNAEDRQMTGPEITRYAEGCDAILSTVTDPLGPETIAALPASVRLIAQFGVGYDNIDATAAAARGIAVTNTPDVLTDATADLAILLLLAAARGASAGERLVRDGKWNGWGPTQIFGQDLCGKRLGFYGFGRIGQATAARALPFGLELHYHARRRVPETPGAAYHESLADLADAVDFLTIHCASTPETRGSVNTDIIERLPAHGLVVNTARGDIVDDDALIGALQSGRIAGAGLDVFKGEPKLDPRYLALPTCFLLPHLGSSTVETRNAMGMRALDNLDAFFAGKKPQDLVNDPSSEASAP